MGNDGPLPGVTPFARSVAATGYHLRRENERPATLVSRSGSRRELGKMLTTSGSEKGLRLWRTVCESWLCLHNEQAGNVTQQPKAACFSVIGGQ